MRRKQTQAHVQAQILDEVGHLFTVHKDGQDSTIDWLIDSGAVTT